MVRKITTIDDGLQLYQSRDLSSRVITHVPHGHELQVDADEVFEGREWLTVSLQDGTTGYTLGPSARSHTTLGESTVGRRLQPSESSIASPTPDIKGRNALRDLMKSRPFLWVAFTLVALVAALSFGSTLINPHGDAEYRRTDLAVTLFFSAFAMWLLAKLNTFAAGILGLVVTTGYVVVGYLSYASGDRMYYRGVIPIPGWLYTVIMMLWYLFDLGLLAQRRQQRKLKL
jgi:hypothetical protein